MRKESDIEVRLMDRQTNRQTDRQTDILDIYPCISLLLFRCSIDAGSKVIVDCDNGNIPVSELSVMVDDFKGLVHA